MPRHPSPLPPTCPPPPTVPPPLPYLIHIRMPHTQSYACLARICMPHMHSIRMLHTHTRTSLAYACLNTHASRDTCPCIIHTRVPHIRTHAAHIHLPRYTRLGSPHSTPSHFTLYHPNPPPSTSPHLTCHWVRNPHLSANHQAYAARPRHCTLTRTYSRTSAPALSPATRTLSPPRSASHRAGDGMFPRSRNRDRRWGAPKGECLCTHPARC